MQRRALAWQRRRLASIRLHQPPTPVVDAPLQRGLLWSDSFPDDSRTKLVAWQVDPLVPPWGVPGELACGTPSRRAPAIAISAPFQFEHVASGNWEAAVGRMASAVGATADGRHQGLEGQGPDTGNASHYREIETRVLRQVTALHDLTDKDLEDWRERERNWQGEQKMLAADTAAWVRALPAVDAAAARGGIITMEPRPSSPRGHHDSSPQKGGRRRAFLKSLLKNPPLPWGLSDTTGRN